MPTASAGVVPTETFAEPVGPLRARSRRVNQSPDVRSPGPAGVQARRPTSGIVGGMTRPTFLATALLLLALPHSALADPLVHTYSIVARDPATGEMGVAVQSHWFSVGSIVTWAEAGVGAVATQSFVDPGYGPRGLALIRGGVSAPDALDQLVKADAQRAGRQVAMIDSAGRVSAYTGGSAIAGGRPAHRRGLFRPGQHDGQRSHLARDEPRV